MVDYFGPTIVDTVLDPESGKRLEIRSCNEYAAIIMAFAESACEHEATGPLRAKLSNGSIHVFNCCKRCGKRVGTAIPQLDRDWVETLPWETAELSEVYALQRQAEKEAMLLDLARHQNSDRDHNQ